MYQIRRITAHGVFIIGLTLMILGISFLLGTMTGISRFSVLRAFLCVIIGAFCAVLAIKLNQRTIYLFFAAFFIMVGLFLFLSALQIIPVTLAQGWPLISVFAGLALLPPGWRHYRAIRYRYLIPSLAFVLMGCLLLVFSFKVAPFSFKRFIINWWPLVVVVTGILLVLLSLSSTQPRRDGSGGERDEIS
ncbi:hypothetical protein AGMMS50230_00590 [Spirochaetia bacterium]|nr:hypothetical protein AGMMS50230_00590 [Spirochaetia bacterium]